MNRITRSEDDMMALIVKTAVSDERIRAVILNGSRTNPSAKKDFLQDYDIVYVVGETESFINDPGWIDCFGERLILQTPQTMSIPDPSTDNYFSYLMLFTDGNRIDLTLIPIEKFAKIAQQDSQSICLLDKDGILPALPPASEKDYHIQSPTQKQFSDCCNEFWWVSIYVAKGLWREETVYACYMLNGPVRNMLIQMIAWQIGIRTNFSVSIGNEGKYLKDHMDPILWQELLDTYPYAKNEEIWEALFAMIKLFRKLAIDVSKQQRFYYDSKEDENINRYLSEIYELPKGTGGVTPNR